MRFIELDNGDLVNLDKVLMFKKINPCQIQYMDETACEHVIHTDTFDTIVECSNRFEQIKGFIGYDLLRN